MKKYETIIIINPASNIPAVIKKYEDLFTKASVLGIPVEVKDEGRKELAYEVKGRREGHFVVYNWTRPDISTPSIDDLERIMRLDDNVLKYMIVKLHEDATYDKPEEDEVATPPAKSEQFSVTDAMDVLLGLDDYHKKDPAPEASDESEQPDGKKYVYTLLEDYIWDNEHNSDVRVFRSWNKAMKEYQELKENEIKSFTEYFDGDDDSAYEQHEMTDDSKKTHAVFEIWHPDDMGFSSSIRLERKEVK